MRDFKKSIVFTILGLILFFLFQARHPSITLGASAPTVDTVTAAATSGGTETSLTLTEGTTTTLYVHGIISDADGCADVATNGTVTGKFYRTNHASGSNCSADNNDCYVIQNNNCAKTNCNPPGDNTLNYECTISIQYYADATSSGPQSATNWTAYIVAKDAAETSGTNTDTIEMNNTLGLSIPSSLTYGTVALDAESSEQTLTITNTGNTGIDIELKGSGNMTCGIGSVAVGQVHYSGTTGFTYSGSTSLTTAFAEHEFNFSPRSNDAAAATKNMYFKLKLPLTGIAGNCSNTITVNTIADTENGW